MLSPNDIIGQKVWLEIPRDPDSQWVDPYRVKAVLTQPTSPPWFYARFEEPPAALHEVGKWLSLHEAQQAVLLSPFVDDYYLDDDYANEEDELELR